MKFIKNMSVTIKILLMVLIPMAGLLYFSISSVADSYQTAGAIQNIQVGIRASAMAGDNHLVSFQECAKAIAGVLQAEQGSGNS